MPVNLQTPYLRDGFTWLRGNLHTHTTLSDGVSPPETVIAEYESRGYDFLAISDHDLLVPPNDYQSRTRMTLIPADEVTSNGPHILAIQIQEIVTPDRDRQKAIDAANEQGGFTILNHPNWQKHFAHWPQQLMEQLNGYTGIEIYNGVVERLEGSALALDRWDRLLAAGRRIWGYANDDSHRPVDIARGWNVVQAADTTVNAICEALRYGRCYASTGVDITRLDVHDNVLSITAPNAQRIRFLGAWGRELSYVDASEASYPATGEEGGYIRVECYGEGIRTAWTQPFFYAESAK